MPHHPWLRDDDDDDDNDDNGAAAKNAVIGPSYSAFKKHGKFYPLPPKSDQHEISPCNLNAL